MTTFENDFGEMYFKELPQGWKVASYEDFFSTENHLILNKPFLIHSELDGFFYGKRVTNSFPWLESDFGIFLDRERIFILDN